MIYIKDKGNKTVINIPRRGDFAPDFATKLDVENLDKRIIKIEENYATKLDVEEIDLRIDAVEEEYATKVYVDTIVGNINNVLEEILN